MNVRFHYIIDWMGTVAEKDDILKKTERLKVKTSTTASQIRINYEFVDLINSFADQSRVILLNGNEFQSDFSKQLTVISPNWTKQMLQKAEVDIDKTFFLGEWIESGSLWKNVSEIIQSTQFSHCFIVISNNEEFYSEWNKIEVGLKEISPKSRAYRIFPSLRDSYWTDFIKHKPGLGSIECKAKDITQIVNFIAMIDPKVGKVRFHKYQEKKKIEIYYLFDYFKIGATAEIQDSFSRLFFDELKKSEGSKNPITKLFCSSLFEYLEESKVDFQSVAFMIVPSSKKGCWNSKLLEEMQLYVKKYELPDTLKTITRVCDTVSLKNGGKREYGAIFSTLGLTRKLPDSIKHVIILDDVTTTGMSFIACAGKLLTNGYKGDIRCFAVAGNQTYMSPSFGYRRTLLPEARPKGKVGYIFDLDGTLIDSKSAKIFRDKGDWDSAKRQIPSMNYAKALAASINRVIRAGCDVAVVTSSVFPYCRKILSYIGIPIGRIICVCYHDTQRHKPFPDPVILAEQNMEHNNAKIICFGDQPEDEMAYNAANQEGIPKFESVDLKCFDSADEEIKAVRILECDAESVITRQDLMQRIATCHPNLRLTDMVFLKWLIDEKLIVKTEKGCFPTQQGVEIGIITENYDQLGKEYYVSRYSSNAQYEILRRTNTKAFEEYINCLENYK